MANDKLWNDIRRGTVDPNSQELFFPLLIKGLLYDLNKTIKIRDKYVVHYIENTGDDTMYLAVKGQNQSIEPMEVSNEDYVYTVVPRCCVTPGGINIQTDQLTAPYPLGSFQIQDDRGVNSIVSEFRRIPVTMKVSAAYYLDTFTDALELVQELITKLAFVNVFKVTYMGQVISCSYNLQDSQDIESNFEFDGLTTESKNRKVTLEYEVQSNLPIFFNRAAWPADKMIAIPSTHMHVGGERTPVMVQHDNYGGVKLNNDSMYNDEGKINGDD